MKNINMIGQTLILFFLSLHSFGNAHFFTDVDSIIIKKEGKILHLTGIMPVGVREIEIRFKSDRNNAISNIKEVSPNNPDYSAAPRGSGQYPGNTFYPVVDIVLERGMEGIAGFKNFQNDSCIVNGPFYKRKQALSASINIPANILMSWENSIFVHTDECELQSFYISRIYPLVTRELNIKVELLSQKWNGEVSIFELSSAKELFKTRVQSNDYFPVKFADNDKLDKDRLLKALDGCFEFTKNSQVKDPSHPADGGLFLFYDLDAELYRSYHWVWGWGPSVMMLLRAAQVLPEKKDELVKLSNDIGEASLRFLWKDPGGALDDIMISRWQRRMEYEDGYLGAITMADALFMAGWAWAPLYEATGDKKFLDAAHHHCMVTDELFKKWTIIPHSYYIDNGQWSSFVIDETGFGMEAFAEMYRITGKEIYQEIGKKFIDGHIETFARPDGQWNRQYQYADGRVTQNTRMVRGMGWAMEGLLCAHRLMPDGGYLEAAKKMAEHLVKSQHPNGSWSFNYDKAVEQTGIGEKGTALWSYLFYELYKYTKEDIYLQVGRKALIWCMNNQYDGSDPNAYGSIVGQNPQSGVGYRSWFNVSCTYTSAFMGMAILEELSLKK
jgi:hypothetical protein